MLVDEIGGDQTDVAQTVLPIERSAVHVWNAIRRSCDANTRETGRIELVDDRVNVATGLLCLDIARRGGYGLAGKIDRKALYVNPGFALRFAVPSGAPDRWEIGVDGRGEDGVIHKTARGLRL